MVRAIAEHEDALFGGMLGLQGGDVAVTCQPEMAILGAGEDFGGPLQQGAEVGVVQALAAAHEEQGLEGAHGVLHRLGVGIAEDLFVVADAEDDRLGLLPIAVQVKDARFVAPQDTFDSGAVSPGHRGEAGDLFDQAVVVGRRQDDAEVPERFEHVASLRPELADGLAQPAAPVAALGGAELGGDHLGGGEHQVEIAGIDLRVKQLRHRVGDAGCGQHAAIVDPMMQETLP